MALKNNTFRILFIALALIQTTGCSKSDEPEVQTMEAVGYIIGYHPCVANLPVTTSKGKGKGYLVETVATKPDTLMAYGIPESMFDIPDEWFSNSGGYLLPDEGRKMFKMRFSYFRSNDENTLAQYPCNGMIPSPTTIKYLKPEYVLTQAEKLN